MHNSKQNINLSKIEAERLAKLINKIKGPVLITELDCSPIGHVVQVTDTNTKHVYIFTEL